MKSTSFSPDLYEGGWAAPRSGDYNPNYCNNAANDVYVCCMSAHIVSSSMSFSSVLLVAVELPEVLLPSSGFTSSSVRQSKSPSDSSCAKQWQHGHARRSAASQTRQHSPTSPVLARCQLTRKAIFRGSTSGCEVMAQGRILLHFAGEATQVKQTLHTHVTCSISTLTLESSSCVLSSSSPFLVLLIVVWLSSSLFTERGSRSDEVVPVASFRSGGEELRDVWRRNSSMANLWNQQLKKKFSTLTTCCCRATYMHTVPLSGCWSAGCSHSGPTPAGWCTSTDLCTSGKM